MGRAFKCDVCGKLYEYYIREDDCSIISIGQKGANAIMFTHNSEYGRDTDNGFRYSRDLCPECMDAVINKLIGLKEKRGEER